jgi:DNA-binding MarR family transcriptional regulator
VGPPAPGGELLAEPAVMAAWRTYFETAQRLTTRMGEWMKGDSGVDLGDFNILMVLAEAPDRVLAMSVLAERLVFSVPRLSYRVRSLEERGWVRKEQDPDDRRVQQVHLTEEGAHTLVRVGQVHRQRVRHVFDEVLTREEIEALGRITAKIAGAVG